MDSVPSSLFDLFAMNKSQIEYIKVEADSVVEIPEVKEDFFTSIKNKAVEIWEYLNGWFFSADGNLYAYFLIRL